MFAADRLPDEYLITSTLHRSMEIAAPPKSRPWNNSTAPRRTYPFVHHTYVERSPSQGIARRQKLSPKSLRRVPNFHLPVYSHKYPRAAPPRTTRVSQPPTTLGDASRMPVIVSFLAPKWSGSNMPTLSAYLQWEPYHIWSLDLCGENLAFGSCCPLNFALRMASSSEPIRRELGIQNHTQLTTPRRPVAAEFVRA